MRSVAAEDQEGAGQGGAGRATLLLLSSPKLALQCSRLGAHVMLTLLASLALLSAVCSYVNHAPPHNSRSASAPPCPALLAGGGFKERDDEEAEAARQRRREREEREE